MFSLYYSEDNIHYSVTYFFHSNVYVLQRDLYISIYEYGLPSWLDGKESTCHAGGTDLIPRSGSFPGGEHGNPLQNSCLKNPMDKEHWKGHSPWGHKELDMTEAT